ncbi:hypothetical protein NGRA_1515 [Nosema granulosis]|uniref:Uncharacterized protein n=1 Tax=Nosema granulosis TaxID=83296 RepID=A0A9P6GYS6_9MICR|nr:hypothetical protein NGRA_1515 [Nosema granulosis]
MLLFTALCKCIVSLQLEDEDVVGNLTEILISSTGDISIGETNIDPLTISDLRELSYSEYQEFSNLIDESSLSTVSSILEFSNEESSTEQPIFLNLSVEHSSQESSSFLSPLEKVDLKSEQGNNELIKNDLSIETTSSPSDSPPNKTKKLKKSNLITGESPSTSENIAQQTVPLDLSKSPIKTDKDADNFIRKIKLVQIFITVSEKLQNKYTDRLKENNSPEIIISINKSIAHFDNTLRPLKKIMVDVNQFLDSRIKSQELKDFFKHSIQVEVIFEESFKVLSDEAKNEYEKIIECFSKDEEGKDLYNKLETILIKFVKLHIKCKNNQSS